MKKKISETAKLVRKWRNIAAFGLPKLNIDLKEDWKNGSISTFYACADQLELALKHDGITIEKFAKPHNKLKA